nr:reverse transcriptase domain-containing protein [Tanacetum cinerariifolium]
MPTTRQGANVVMTTEAIQAMIYQTLLRNNTTDDGSQDSGGRPRRPVQPALRTLGPDAAYAMTWEVLKKKLTDKYFPKGEIKKLQIELWNLKVKGNDVGGYTHRFQELALLCTKFLSDETEKIDKYISGLPDNIHGNFMSARTKNLDDAIELAIDLMDHKLHTYAERQAENKRNSITIIRLNNNVPRDKMKAGTISYKLELPQQLIRVHNTFHVSNLKKCLSDESLVIPLGELHIDDKLRFVEEPMKVVNCKLKQLKKSRIPIIKELALLCERMFLEESDKVEKYVGGLPDIIQGSMMASKPKKMHDTIEFETELMDQKIHTLAELTLSGVSLAMNVGLRVTTRKTTKVEKQESNQAGNGNVVARAYAVGMAGANPNYNVVTGTFLLNNHYALILFDTDADRSFVSISFSSLNDTIPTTLDHGYDVE